jgi:hypothetical protein
LFEDDYFPASPAQFNGGTEAEQPGPDDHELGVSRDPGL